MSVSASSITYGQIKILKDCENEFSFLYNPSVDLRVDVVNATIVDQIVDAIVIPNDLNLQLNS